MEAAIQAPGPSFRDMQFCAGGGYFFGRSARGFGASFCNLLEGSVRQWEAAIQAPGPSFRDMQFCAGGGYFFGLTKTSFNPSDKRPKKMDLKLVL